MKSAALIADPMYNVRVCGMVSDRHRLAKKVAGRLEQFSQDDDGFHVKV